MNKIYVSPDFKVVKIGSTLSLCAISDPESYIDTETMDSKAYQGPAGGLLWEDDNNVTE